MHRTIGRLAFSSAALALLGSGLLLGVVGLAPAGASCAPPLDVPASIAQSDVVVVGTVTATRSRDRIATVKVEEVWKGGVNTSFEVSGGPAADNALTSVDRTYEVGRKYLLFAREPAVHGDAASFGGQFEDNACSATQTWDDTLTRFRPTSATTITTAPSGSPVSTATDGSSDSGVGWFITAALAAASLLGAGLVYRARRRGRHRQGTS